ncbi:MAG: anthranilate phosphoribosyltransferase [Acidobacteria bacterium]|nr:anthranilate phosphoribosyltransferase [Acidobacteriota bacterium]
MFTALIDKLHLHRDLTEDEASAAMAEIMAGRATSAQIAALLVGLSMKGERPSEIVGLATAMRAASRPLARSYEDVFDTCGTGGDRQRTFNVSSLSALVLAACGVRVAKHGNRSVSSTCGSADLFEALGVNVAAAPETVERCLAEVGMAFFFAPTFHPSMRHAGPTRRELGIRTVFNLLGPLTNPARAGRQVIGVSQPEQTDLIAQVLVRLGSERAWVVHGVDGVDEVSAGGYTKVSECRAGQVHTFFVQPSDFGVDPVSLDDVRVQGVEDGVALAREVLAGAGGSAGDFVVVNAAASLLVAGKVSSLREGAQAARAVLADGTASRKLDALAAASHTAG